MDKEEKYFVIGLAVWLVLYAVVDPIITGILLQSPNTVEINPLARMIFGTMVGVTWGILLIKLITTASVLFLMIVVFKKDRLLGIAGLYTLCGMTALAVLINITTLLGGT